MAHTHGGRQVTVAGSEAQKHDSTPVSLGQWVRRQGVLGLRARMSMAVVSILRWRQAR